MRPPAQAPAEQAANARKRNAAVPYITSWSAESRPLDRLVTRSRLRGIAYADEVPHDRDGHGILWRRSILAPGRGRPEFGSVHSARQRRVMRRLLCQICAGPPDRTDMGVLWLLGDDRGDWPTWPEKMGATHPPLCLRCAAASVRLCPYLYNYAAVRVREPHVGGVYGVVHRSGLRGPEPIGFDTIPYGDARLPWVQASQLVMRLEGCTFVDLEAELSAAGITFGRSTERRSDSPTHSL
jgi:hypothetical protein